MPLLRPLCGYYNKDNNKEELLRHEYGHTVQSLILGCFGYLQLVYHVLFGVDVLVSIERNVVLITFLCRSLC